MRDEKSLAHTRWNCKYHIVFAPKYRRQVFYGEKRKAIASGNPAEDECFGLYGVLEGEEQSDAL